MMLYMYLIFSVLVYTIYICSYAVTTSYADNKQACNVSAIKLLKKLVITVFIVFCSTMLCCIDCAILFGFL